VKHHEIPPVGRIGRLLADGPRYSHRRPQEKLRGGVDVSFSGSAGREPGGGQECDGKDEARMRTSCITAFAFSIRGEFVTSLQGEYGYRGDTGM
jgi:hypothetical protein